MDNLDELLGIDPDDAVQQNAIQLVEADNQLLDDLVALRKKQGLTQGDVAQRLGVNQSSIARIECGERDPHLSTLRRYAHAIGAEVHHRVKPFAVATKAVDQEVAWSSAFEAVLRAAAAGHVGSMAARVDFSHASWTAEGVESDTVRWAKARASAL